MQPEVRLRHGQEPRRKHTQQHTARAGAGWQAHPSELCRCPARRSRSRLRPRAQLATTRVFGDATARAPTCGTCPARTPWPIHARFETLQRAHCGRCSTPRLQLWLQRTDERFVPQRGSETKREFFSHLRHLEGWTIPLAEPLGARGDQEHRLSIASENTYAMHFKNKTS